MIDGWVRNAKVTRIIDGDTVVVDVELGYQVGWQGKVRLYGINAPERRGKSKPEGIKATEHLRHLLDSFGWDVVLKSHKNKAGKYGRWIVEIIAGDVNINQRMVLDGHAVRYDP